MVSILVQNDHVSLSDCFDFMPWIRDQFWSTSATGYYTSFITGASWHHITLSSSVNLKWYGTIIDLKIHIPIFLCNLFGSNSTNKEWLFISRTFVTNYMNFFCGCGCFAHFGLAHFGKVILFVAHIAIFSKCWTTASLVTISTKLTQIYTCRSRSHILFLLFLHCRFVRLLTQFHHMYNFFFSQNLEVCWTDFGCSADINARFQTQFWLSEKSSPHCIIIYTTNNPITN